MHLPTHNPLESHSFPAHASCFSHTNAQVLIPCHRFSVAALGLNPHARYLSPVTITRYRHLLPNSLSPVSNPLLLTAEPLLPVKGAETLHLSPSPSLPEFVVAAMLDKSMMKLNNENYEIWKILMEAILVRKQLCDVALGWTLRPAGPPNAVQAWDWKNQEARAELQLAVEWDQLAHMTAKDASEIWAELERVHRSTGFTTHIGLKRQLWKMKMKDGQRMASAISDVKGILFQLSQIGVAVPDENIILALTNGLPTPYNYFILTLDSTPSEVSNLNYVIGRLWTEETRQHAKSGSPDMTDEVLAVTRDRPRRLGLAHITCFACGNKGHYQVNCPTHSPQTPAPLPPHTISYKPVNKPVTATTTTEEGLLMVEGTEDGW